MVAPGNLKQVYDEKYTKKLKVMVTAGKDKFFYKNHADVVLQVISLVQINSCNFVKKVILSEIKPHFIILMNEHQSQDIKHFCMT